jgi:hypothetical protein
VSSEANTIREYMVGFITGALLPEGPPPILLYLAPEAQWEATRKYLAKFQRQLKPGSYEEYAQGRWMYLPSPHDPDPFFAFANHLLREKKRVGEGFTKTIWVYAFRCVTDHSSFGTYNYFTTCY